MLFHPHSSDSDSTRQWGIGAVLNISDLEIELAPVCLQKTGRLDSAVQVVVDWEREGDFQTVLRHETNILLLPAHSEMRVVEDRVRNPHGEESEQCWIVDLRRFPNESLSSTLAQQLKELKT